MYYKSLYPPLPQVPQQNVYSFLLSCRERFGGDLASHPLYVNAVTGTSWSYQEFQETVRDGATAMGSDMNVGGLGMRAENGELVGVLSENSMDYVALLHSLLVLTVPFVTLSSYATPFEFQHAFKLAAPTRLFVSPTLLPLALTSGLPQERIYILEGNVPGHVSYGDLVTRARANKLARLPVQQARSDTLAYLLFSSGTTGLPKAVMTSHGNLVCAFSQLLVMFGEALKVQGSLVSKGPGGIMVSLSVLPMHHVYGLYIATFSCFLVPSTVVLLPKWSADTYFDSISKYRVTSIYLVPSLVHQIVHHPRFPTADFSTVQSTFCSAAYLPVSLAEKLCSRFPGVDQVNEGYGMSESTIPVAVKPFPGMLEGRAKLVPGSIGILLPGVEACIVCEDGRLASLNEPGELHVRSGTVALGYWKNEKATKETFKDGWLRTGDRVRIDADGVLYFEDRAKDTLKVSGMQVSPMEIEETLRQHPEGLIIDVTVAGVSGGRTADERIPRAWVVLSSKGKSLGATEVVARLDARVREALSRYKWLRGGIAVVDQIPKSPTGKVLRRVLVDEHEAGLRSSKGKL